MYLTCESIADGDLLSLSILYAIIECPPVEAESGPIPFLLA
jgi:hypothetical protein